MRCAATFVTCQQMSYIGGEMFDSFRMKRPPSYGGQR